LDRPGEERKNRGRGGGAAADVEAADVDASLDPGMGSGASDPAGARRSREKHSSIVVYAFALARVLSGFSCLLGANTSGWVHDLAVALPVKDESGMDIIRLTDRKGH
jgi:hypothetical protein